MSSSSSEDAEDRDTLEVETPSTVHARAAYAAWGREWRFRSRFLAVRADILLPFLFFFVLRQGFPTPLTSSARHSAHPPSSRLRGRIGSRLNARVRRSAPAATQAYLHSPHLTSVVSRLALVPDAWWMFDARHSCPSAQHPRLPMPAFTPPSESDDPCPETRLDVAASTVDRPEYAAVQQRDSILLDA
jgi:hypothetical protein